MTRQPEPDCWLHPDVAIAKSAIAGKGLFAQAPIAAGTVVSRVGGRLVSYEELRTLIASADGARIDSIVVDRDTHLVLPSGTANRYGNHSCDPNLGWTDEYTLVSLRDIAAGEELTNDYATSTADARFVLYCHCETYRCRQLVAGDDWRIPELQRRYDGHWVPFLQRRIATGPTP